VVHAQRLARAEKREVDPELLEIRRALEARALELAQNAAAFRSHHCVSRALRTNQPCPFGTSPCSVETSSDSGTTDASLGSF
jgi:hypothetical protein